MSATTAFAKGICCFFTLAAAAAALRASTTPAASIVEVVYSQNNQLLARMIYSGRDGGASSDPANYWKLLNTASLFYDVAIKPSNANNKAAGLEAKLTGDVRISVSVRPYVKIGGNARYSGKLELKSLRLARVKPDSDRWYLPKEECDRIKAIVAEG